jgi:hypothetical protein
LICWTNADKNEILVGRGDSVIDADKNQFREENMSIPTGKVVGLAYFNNIVVAASDTGKIHIIDGNAEEFSSGDNTTRMRQSPNNPESVHLKKFASRQLKLEVPV